MSVEALQAIGKEGSKLLDLGYRLKGLAAAHHAVGNDYMSETLYTFSKDVLDSQKAISAATGQWVSSDLKRAGESSVNLLNAALTGAKLAEEQADGG